jgi:transglutaminase-like putative cysteine protease
VKTARPLLLLAALGFVAVLGGGWVAGEEPLPVRTRLPMVAGDSAEYRPPFYFPITIDYANPAAHLQQGTQSTLSAESQSALAAELGDVPDGLPGVAAIHHWMRETFHSVPSLGQDIGKTDVNSLLVSRTFTGCHDWALMMTSVLRHSGTPAIMVDTAAIQWAFDFHAGHTMNYVGHVFSEVYVEGQWIAVDCTSGLYTEDYDPLHPVLPFRYPGQTLGFYVLYKGVDPAGYGVTSNEVLTARMREFAAVVDQLQLPLPDAEVRSLEDVR